MTQPSGRVYLVGAGCGPAEWITLRGYRLLQTCDAVVYDDLIAPELLDAVPLQARKLYMGKRLGRHSAPQEDISQTLIALAQAGHTVVRLKGGDPFVFDLLRHRHPRPGGHSRHPPGAEPQLPRDHRPHKRWSL